MGKRNIAEGVEKRPYFEVAAGSQVSQRDEGTRELGALYPFVISGGTNTERYYFMHVNDVTSYKFNVKPKYFGDESNYTDVFPMRIKEILERNHDAKVFCVFDWDTIYGDKTKQKKHADFEAQFKEEIESGTVTLCPSMPSIEYWFLLHFTDDTILLKTYSKVANVLAPHLKPCFPEEKAPLKKLLKSEKYLQDTTWVENLCAGGKLEKAIERAENNIRAAEADGTLEEQSYSYVYQAFKACSK